MRALRCALFMLLALATPALAQEDPLVQRGVPAEATAETAVIARDLALASGQRLAFERMAAATGISRGMSDQQIQDMVRSIVVESERITARGYSGRITVNFMANRVASLGGRLPAAAPGPDGAMPTAPLAVPGAAPMPTTPAVATVEVLARYRSFRDWIEITRRLGSAPPVARVEVVTIAGDQARLRLGLRTQPMDAAAELATGGLELGPGPMDARPGEGWRLSLAGGR